MTEQIATLADVRRALDGGASSEEMTEAALARIARDNVR